MSHQVRIDMRFLQPFHPIPITTMSFSQIIGRIVEARSERDRIDRTVEGKQAELQMARVKLHETAACTELLTRFEHLADQDILTELSGKFYAVWIDPHWSSFSDLTLAVHTKPLVWAADVEWPTSATAATS